MRNTCRPPNGGGHTACKGGPSSSCPSTAICAQRALGGKRKLLLGLPPSAQSHMVLRKEQIYSRDFAQARTSVTSYAKVWSSAALMPRRGSDGEGLPSTETPVTEPANGVRLRAEGTAVRCPIPW